MIIIVTIVTTVSARFAQSILRCGSNVFRFLATITRDASHHWRKLSLSLALTIKAWSIIAFQSDGTWALVHALHYLLNTEPFVTPGRAPVTEEITLALSGHQWTLWNCRIVTLICWTITCVSPTQGCEITCVNVAKLISGDAMNISCQSQLLTSTEHGVHRDAFPFKLWIWTLNWKETWNRGIINQTLIAEEYTHARTFRTSALLIALRRSRNKLFIKRTCTTWTPVKMSVFDKDNEVCTYVPPVAEPCWKVASNWLSVGNIGSMNCSYMHHPGPNVCMDSSNPIII